MVIKSFFAALVLVGCAPLPIPTIDISVWSTDDIADHFEVKSTHEDGPCGATSQIALSSFPDFDRARDLGFDAVIEYSGDALIGGWSIPANGTILAISGDSLYVPYGSLDTPWGTKALRLVGSGDFEVTPIPPNLIGTAQSCPSSVISHFEPSSYTYCTSIKDFQTGNIRYLGLQGPCT